MPTIEELIQELAAEALSFVEYDEYLCQLFQKNVYCLAKNAPDWLKTLADGINPNKEEFLFDYLAEALKLLKEGVFDCHQFKSDKEITQLFRWLANQKERISILEITLKELYQEGTDLDLVGYTRWLQAKEKKKIFYKVKEFLASVAETM